MSVGGEEEILDHCVPSRVAAAMRGTGEGGGRGGEEFHTIQVLDFAN